MHRFVLAAALLLVLPLQGCDETPGTGTPDDLLTDARIARQAGDLDVAVDLLETAFEASPDDAVVRTELAVTLFQEAGLDLADLDRIAQFLLDEGTAPLTATPETAGKGGDCPYEGEAEAFDPRDLDGYIEYVESDDTIDRVLALLAPVIARELRPEDFLCTGIVDGELAYDAAAARAEMRAEILASDPDLSDAQADDLLASALAVNASARLLAAYNFVVTDIAPVTDWYRLGDDAFGVCFDGVTEDELRTMSEGAVADIGEALTSIDLRSEILDSTSSTQELVDLLLDAYEQVRAEIGPVCDPS